MLSMTLRAALVAAIASTAFAHPVLERRDDAVTVELSQISDTEVTATVKNVASETLQLLNYGTFMDDDAVQKVVVKQNQAEVQFTGILKTYLLTDLSEDAFTTLAPGETYNTTINLPAVHAMQDGGDFDVETYGGIPFAAANSTELVGAAHFVSNTVSLNVAPEVAQAVKSLTPSRKHKRTQSQNCDGDEGAALSAALTNTVALANQASQAALSGSTAKFQEYFKTTDASTRQTVADRFSSIAQEASSSGSGGTTYSCTDDYQQCSSGVLAYTYPSLNHIANCPLYYSGLSALNSRCHGQDQATTTLHEFTHAPAVVNPSTDDFAYGYSASSSLSSSRALQNADTYALYANALYAGC